jgi:hypothetical protein
VPSPIDPRNLEVVDDQMAEVLRQKSPVERLAIAHGLWRTARNMLQNVLRSQHPDWSDAEVDREVARRLSHGAA